MGAHALWLSLGPAGSLFATGEVIHRLTAPAPHAVVNAVGCGDALIGGFAAGLIAGGPLAAAVLGVAAATEKLAPAPGPCRSRRGRGPRGCWSKSLPCERRRPSREREAARFAGCWANSTRSSSRNDRARVRPSRAAGLRRRADDRLPRGDRRVWAAPPRDAYRLRGCGRRRRRRALQRSELRRRGVDVDACRVEAQRAPGSRSSSARGPTGRSSPRRGRRPFSRAPTSAMSCSARRATSTSPRPHCRLAFALPCCSCSPGHTRPGCRPRSIPAGIPTAPGPAGRRCARRGRRVLPNAAEACRLAGVEDPGAALDALAERAETVVVKLGADGAIGRRGDETARADAVAAVVDTTGAGDSFTAGFSAPSRRPSPRLGARARRGLRIAVDSRPGRCRRPAGLTEAAEVAESLAVGEIREPHMSANAFVAEREASSSRGC